jgi:hypothetical protein
MEKRDDSINTKRKLTASELIEQINKQTPSSSSMYSFVTFEGKQNLF